MYDVIVIGGGHAGCEAVLSCKRLGLKALLITGNIEMIASLPCNPSIGGPAKGIVVREIDALGGEMGKNIDVTHIQMKMLNSSRGPAVRALRAQADKIKYPKQMQKTIKENVDVVEAYVNKLLIEKNIIKGVILEDETLIKSNKVIITTGTYLNSSILVGHNEKKEGPDNQKTTNGISNQLKELGFNLMRLKTGTPARIKKSSINYSILECQPGDNIERKFSVDTKEILPLNDQIDCHLTYTTKKTKEIIENNLNKSSMYSGSKRGVGPRYCPSIEDKIVRFNDKERHQIFLEPESRGKEEIYVAGLSTSMPHNIQEEMLKSVIGLENCEIIKYAYAIEYDAIDPTQLYPTLESKIVENLYFAGQINGTSGYEEAGCQGLMAGINATRKHKNEEPFVLKRSDAYIGVLIDDLVTKGTKEPYRLLTSRAEFRLLLRHDNADIRLREYGYDIGLVDRERYNILKQKLINIKEEKERLSKIFITSKKETNEYLTKINTANLKDRLSLLELLKRPEIEYHHIHHFDELSKSIEEEVYSQVVIDTKYAGYIKKMIVEDKNHKKLELKKIPNDIIYDDIINLSLEAREKLKKIKPLNIGQASRISGVNPSDISVMLIYLKAKRGKHGI